MICPNLMFVAKKWRCNTHKAVILAKDFGYRSFCNKNCGDINKPLKKEESHGTISKGKHAPNNDGLRIANIANSVSRRSNGTKDNLSGRIL